MSRTVDFVALMNSVDFMPVVVAVLVLAGIYALCGILTLLAVRG
jgi:hypothetical protein